MLFLFVSLIKSTPGACIMFEANGFYVNNILKILHSKCYKTVEIPICEIPQEIHHIYK